MAVGWPQAACLRAHCSLSAWGRPSLFPLLTALMPLCSLAVPASLPGTTIAAHAALGNLLKEKSTARRSVFFSVRLVVSVASLALPYFSSAFLPFCSVQRLDKSNLIISVLEPCDWAVFRSAEANVSELFSLPTWFNKFSLFPEKNILKTIFGVGYWEKKHEDALFYPKCRNP